MDIITLSVQIPADHHLVLDLPVDTPVGQAELIIKPHSDQPLPNPAREAARAKLLAAGKLLTGQVAPEGAIRSSKNEHQRLIALFGQGPSSDMLIDEDRVPHE